MRRQTLTTATIGDGAMLMKLEKQAMAKDLEQVEKKRLRENRSMQRGGRGGGRGRGCGREQSGISSSGPAVVDNESISTSTHASSLANSARAPSLNPP